LKEYTSASKYQIFNAGCLESCKLPTYIQCLIPGSWREFHVYGRIYTNFRFYLILQYVMGIYTSVLKQPEPQANHSPQCNTEQSMYTLNTREIVLFTRKQHVLIFENNQLDAQFFCQVCLFLFSTCFGQPCAHHQEN